MTAFRLFAFRPSAASAFPTSVGQCLRQLACTTLIGLGAGQAYAQTTPQPPAQDTALTRLVQKNQFALTQNGAQFGGPGWEKLQQDIQKSQLVLIGEDHGMAQIPVFATAVAKVLKPKVYVAEIDKYQARNLSDFAARPGLPTAFEHKYPMALSFYSWAEEFELARSLKAQNTAFVGIEQVGAATAGLTLDVMADQVKNKAAKAYLRRLAAASQARDRADMVTGKYEHTTVKILQPVTMDSLRTLARKENPMVQELLENFLASVAIYQTNFAGKPGAHQMRLNLMKRNLLTELLPYQKAAEPLPPMLFKFGAAHMGRGRSILGNFYDVGNLAVNLADMHDQKTLHIFIIGKQGTQAGGANPDDFSKNVAKYSYDNENMIKPFANNTATTGPWQVFDVRPLRRALLQDKLNISSQELQATILGYDYVVIIPETTASHNY